MGSIPLKSVSLTFFRTPVEKNARMGMMAIMPMSPTHSTIVNSTHHKPMVTKQTKVTQYCLRVNLSLDARMGLISSSDPSGVRPGR